ncbi:MAG TPA: hypothetical protein VFJ64_07545 [Solirubrobacterales bacterium]|nr:hypothetical protein [Solirubrobacterales bacterium]
MVGALAWAATPAQATTATFAFTGGEQTFVVPAGVTSVHVVAIGGSGGASEVSVPGGAAAQVTGDVVVTPGQTLYVEVGGRGQTGAEGGAGGFNGGAAGGGGGGGASDVRTSPASSGLSPDHRLIVAAGGGGGGATGGENGGAGGAAGSPGAEAGYPGGGAGTATEGGAGAFGCEASGEGGKGQLGTGGAGGNSFVVTGPGGGGGGGLYGGGGGGGACIIGSGGGGGGSSLVPAGGSFAVASLVTAPQVEISYTPASSTGPVTKVPSPNTVLGFHPPKTLKTKKKKAKVKFTFSSSVAGASFKCKLDKGSFAPCRSPKVYKVKPGKHKFSVEAVGAGGADPTPATFSFKVKKKT